MCYYVLLIVFLSLIHILPSLVFNIIHLQEKFHENGSNLNIMGIWWEQTHGPHVI